MERARGGVLAPKKERGPGGEEPEGGESETPLDPEG